MPDRAGPRRLQSDPAARYRNLPAACGAPPRAGSLVPGGRPRFGQRDLSQRSADRPGPAAFRRPAPARPDRARLHRGSVGRLGPHPPRRPPRPREPRGPLGDPPERCRRRRVPARGRFGGRRRVAQGPARQPRGDLPGHQGDQPYHRARRPPPANPGHRLRFHRRRSGSDPARRRRGRGPTRPQGRPMARRRGARARRAAHDLDDDRRPRPRDRTRRHHRGRHRRPPLRPEPVDRRLRDPRGDLRPGRGPPLDLGRDLRRHPRPRADHGRARRHRPIHAGTSDAPCRDRPSGRAGHREWRAL